MPIEIRCSCGNQIPNVTNYWVSEISCSKCGRKLTAPGASTSESTLIESSQSYRNLLGFFDEVSDNLIVFGDTAIFYDSLEREELSKKITLLRNEEFNERVITRSMQKIAYSTISEVSCNLNDTRIFFHRGPAESFNMILLNLHDLRSRSHCLSVITNTFGKGWTNKVHYCHRLSVAGLPVVILSILIAILLFLLWVSTFPELDPAKVPLIPPHHLRPRRSVVVVALVLLIFSIVGWFWIGCVICGLILFVLIWLALRVANPPIEWTLTRPAIDDIPILEEMADRRDSLGVFVSGVAEQSLSVGDGRDQSMPCIAWISRKLVAEDQTSDDAQPEEAEEGNATIKSKKIGGVTWGVLFAILIGISYIVGRLLVLADLLARISNEVFLTVHLVSLAYLVRQAVGFARYTNVLNQDDVKRAMLIRLTIVVVFSLLSAVMITIKPSDHIVFSAFATGLSFTGALLEIKIVQNSLIRNKGQFEDDV